MTARAPSRSRGGEAPPHRPRLARAHPLRFLLPAAGQLLSQAAQATAFLAPEPPDSVVLAAPAERGRPLYRVFLSKRAPEEIRAFYDAQVGPFTQGPSAAHGVESRVVLTYQQVLDILHARRRDLTLADDLKVKIDWKPPPASHAACSGDFFQQLMTIARLQKRQPEFDRLCARYGYLESAYFQKVPDPRRAGQWIDADKEILARAHDRHGGRQTKELGASSQQTAQRMQELALSGRTAEARALAEQFKAQAARTTDSAMDWDAWVKVLEEGDAQGYRTWIFLPTHPSEW